MILKVLPLFLCLFLTTGLFAQEIELNPEKGWRGRALSVNVSGTNTTFQSATTTCGFLTSENVSFQQASETIFRPSNVSVFDDVSMNWTVGIPFIADPGVYDVVLWDGDPDCKFSCPGCFVVLDPPVITGVEPNSTPLGEDVDATINGTDLCFDIGSPNCNFALENVVFTSIADASTLTPIAIGFDNGMMTFSLDLDGTETPGMYNISISDGLPCAAACASCFEIIPPEGVIEVTGTDLGIQGEDVTVVIEIENVDVGNCNYQTGDIFLELNGYTIPVSNLTVTGNQLSFDVSIPDDAPLGNYSIIVADGQGMPCSIVCDGCFMIDEDSGINDAMYQDGLIIYPNPSNGVFTVLSDIAIKMVEVQIYSINGQLVHQQMYQRFMKETIDLDLDSGTYMMKMIKDGEICVRKLIVNK